MSKLLRYRISEWSQLTECLSNNSADLYITVSTFMGDTVSGQMVEVHHSSYGTLFAAMLSGKGDIISTKNEDEVVIPWLTTDQILSQLEKFGFLIEFSEASCLDGDQLSYLMTLRGLGYDSLAPITLVRYNETGTAINERLIVAFDGNVMPSWLVSGAIVSEKEFRDALSLGQAVNVSAMSEKYDFRWDWLTFVANIDDVLDDNSGSALLN